MTDKVLAFGVEPSVSKYRLRLARYPALAQSVTDFVSESAAEQPRLLDIGVGYGRTYRYVQQLGLADRIDWHGVDLRRLPKDEMAGAGAWNVSLANVEEGLPFPDDHFDVVIAEQILEHLQRPDRALQEICRVARPGAQVIIGVPIFPGPIARLRNAYIRHFPKTFAKSGSGHLQTFSLKTIRALLREHGQFEEQSVRGFRVLSGGPLRPLENYRWWWQWNSWLGRRIPGLCVEVQFRLVYRPPNGQSSRSQGQATDLRDDQSESAATQPELRPAAGLRR